ncbi:ABC transporter substrate-binding protein [Cellulomonas citrea]|uniref:ABC transporter substrate-binding protein n=1 Tax=Cellulomonas citrea TaxID=1909423 RepID=UPI00135BBE91|nr:sugar ABC transporter substrate-binding protein [Cellulomonas citrea]
MSRAPRVAAALVTASALALAGCSGSASSGASSSSDGKVTITYSNFISNGGNEANLTKIVDAFEAANPDITVKVTTLPYADYFTALQTDLAGGTAADVFDMEYAGYAALQSSGVLAPLDGVDGAAYKPSLLDAYQTDGTQYALPSSFSTVVLFYNKALFDAAGVSYPTSSWTWADEKAAAEKLTNASAGVWGDYQPISYYEFYKAVAQAGGSFLSKDGKKAAFNDAAGKAAAQWLVGKSGTVMPTTEQGAGTADFDKNLFTAGKLAMWHSGSWMFGVVGQQPFGWDVAVEPGDTTKASALFSNAVGVSATSAHKEAAQKWAQFLTSSPTTVSVRLDAGWELPPTSDESALASYLTKGTPANRQAVFDSLDAVALAPSIGDNQTKMQDVVSEKLTEAAAGRLTVQQALDQAETEVNALLG